MIYQGQEVDKVNLTANTQKELWKLIDKATEGRNVLLFTSISTLSVILLLAKKTILVEG